MCSLDVALWADRCHVNSKMTQRQVGGRSRDRVGMSRSCQCGFVIHDPVGPRLRGVRRDFACELECGAAWRKRPVMVDDADDDRGHLRHSNDIGVHAMAECGKLAIRDCLGNHPYRLQPVFGASLSLRRSRTDVPVSHAVPRLPLSHWARRSSRMRPSTLYPVSASRWSPVASCRSPFKATGFEPTFFLLRSPPVL